MDNNKRTIRVFISSTFQDMQEERDVLVKKIFPQLRKLCMERGVGFTEVDLRWGVTQEQAERGEVLPVCLSEIENCRPFFIGLLGERYGWVPEFIPEELIAEQPWLAEHLQRSVTELEIIHGVLNNPAMAGHAFFYFRDPSSSPDPSQDKEAQDRQNRLKDRIRKNGFPVSENYKDPETVGQLVLKDLENAINKEFPEQDLTRLERDRLDPDVFAESRAKVYIGRQDYFDRLDKHVQGTGDPVVVIGDSGSGKSALLANWCFHFQEKHPDTFLLTHFIGSSADSTDCTTLLRRIMMEIKDRYDLQMDIPEKPEELRAQFPNWLSMAAARGKSVLVLDALNQLENRDNTHELIWLPEWIPPEVRLVVSTLPDKCLDVLVKRDWPTLKVEPLELDERKQLIKEYLLRLYSKRLPEDVVNYISSREQCANPLFLHALLEELRIFGKHEEIKLKIDHYLQAGDTGKLYELILARLEEDYERERPGLVGEAMTLLWAARRGLSEPELLEIMDLPHLAWSPLSLALQDSLVTRSGLLNFFHDYLRQAIHQKYIKTSETEKDIRLRLSGYFSYKEINERKIDELPWQLSQAQEWELLQKCLADVDFFNHAYNRDEFEVKSYWEKIESNSDLTCTRAYQKVFDSPDQFIFLLTPLSRLFQARGNLDEAMQLLKVLEDGSLSSGNKEDLSISLGDQAVILSFQGDFDEAMKFYSEAEKICREIGNQDGLQACLGNRASIIYTRGSVEKAKTLYKEAEEICREYGIRDRLPMIFCGQADVFKAQGEFEDAIECYKSSEQICRELGNKTWLLYSLIRQASIFNLQGKVEKAIALNEEAVQICREIGDKNGLQLSLVNQAGIFYNQGKLEQAIKLHEEAEQICRETANKNGLAACLNDQALVFKAQGKLEDAKALYKESESLCREIGNKNGLAVSLINQTHFLNENINQIYDALPLAEEAYHIASCHGLNSVLQQIRTVFKQINQTIFNYHSDEGSRHKKHENYEQAFHSYNASHSAIESVLRMEPDNIEWQERLSLNYHDMSDILKMMNNDLEASKAYKASRMVIDRMVAKHFQQLNDMWKSGDRQDLHDALKLAEITVDLCEKYLAEDQEIYDYSLQYLGIAYRNVGDFENSELVILKAIELNQKYWGEKHVKYGSSLKILADTYTVWNKKISQAEPLYLEALSIFESNLGRESDLFHACRMCLEQFQSNLAEYGLDACMLTEAQLDFRMKKKLEGKPLYKIVPTTKNDIKPAIK